MILSGFFIFDWVNEQIHRFLLLLDAGVYWLASECYQLFIKLAQTRIFEDSFFSDFAKRIYAVLGVFMLFYLAYALLMAIVDPDKLSKGDKSAGKIASNLVISLVLLGFLPSIFNYAYRLQNYILSSNLIGTLVLGTAPIEVNTSDDDSEEEVTGREEDTTTIDSSILSYGDVLSFTLLNVFLNSDNVNVIVGETDDHQDYTWYDLKADIFENSNYFALPGMAEAVSTGSTIYGTGQEVVVDYKIIISTAAGIFLVYIMFSFALDLGVRVVKLAFYQLIAPLPVIMRIIPSKKSVFDKWVKQTLSVYFEVFIRVAIMYMAIYFIHGIMSHNTLKQLWDAGIQGKLALAIVIMGILIFAKQASKMISDLFGIETGGLKLGIGEKLKAGGFFAAGAALGAGAGGLLRNAAPVFGRAGQRLVGIGKGWSGANGARAKAALIGGGVASAVGALVGGIPSTFAGGTSGIYHGFMAGKDSKGWGDMLKGASRGADRSLQNREARAAYKAAHGGTMRGAVAGHIPDTGASVVDWFGGGFESQERENKFLANVNAQNEAMGKAVKDLRQKNESNIKIIPSEIQFKEAQKAEEAMYNTRFKGSTLATMRNYLNNMRTSTINQEDFYRTSSIVGPDGKPMRTFDKAAYEKAQLDKAKEEETMENMIRIVEKAAEKKIKTEAFSPDFDSNFDASRLDISKDKYSEIRNHAKQMEDLVKEHGPINNPNITHPYTTVTNDFGGVSDDFGSDIKNALEIGVVDLERRKRAQEARKKNSGKGK